LSKSAQYSFKAHWPIAAAFHPKRTSALQTL
jgi:hypothetical protein